MLQTVPSQTAFVDTSPDEWPAPRLPGLARPNVLLASLAAAVITFSLSGASLVYAFTHIPEVDPNAEAAPVAEVAAIAAQAPDVPTKLEVLPPPVYGVGVVSEAPAMGFVPLSARVHMDTSTVDAVDPYKLSEADGITRPCDDPCSAQAGYVAQKADDQTAKPVVATAQDDNDDDGNAPPPPGMVVN